MSNRCYICDFSPSNKQSLFNPEVEYYPEGVRLQTDEIDRRICSYCLEATQRYAPKYQPTYGSLAVRHRRHDHGTGGEDTSLVQRHDLSESED